MSCRRFGYSSKDRRSSIERAAAPSIRDFAVPRVLGMALLPERRAQATTPPHVWRADSRMAHWSDLVPASNLLIIR